MRLADIRFTWDLMGGPSPPISGAGAVERLWVWLHRFICVAWTTAVLLGLLQQADLFLEQLIFELHVFEFEIQFLLKLRLANAALIKAALNQQPWRRQCDLLFP